MASRSEVVNKSKKTVVKLLMIFKYLLLMFIYLKNFTIENI